MKKSCEHEWMWQAWLSADVVLFGNESAGAV